MSLSDQLAEEIAQGKAKKLLKAIVTEIALDPELRAIIVKEVAGELVTKKDLKETEERLERKIEEVRKELDARIDELRKEINELRNQFISLTKWMIGLMASMWISIVIGIIVALMKMK